MGLKSIIYTTVVVYVLSYCGCGNSTIDDMIIGSYNDTVSDMLYYENFFNSEQQIVRSKAFYFDTVNKVYVLSGIDEFWYNEFGKVERELFYAPNEKLEIKPLELDSIFYNKDGCPTDVINFVSCGESDSWIKVVKHNFRYKKDDTLKFCDSKYSWDSDKNSWLLNTEAYFDYDSLGRVVSQLTYELDPHDTSKVQKNFQEFYYPDNQKIND